VHIAKYNVCTSITWRESKYMRLSKHNSTLGSDNLVKRCSHVLVFIILRNYPKRRSLYAWYRRNHHRPIFEVTPNFRAASALISLPPQLPSDPPPPLSAALLPQSVPISTAHSMSLSEGDIRGGGDKTTHSQCLGIDPVLDQARAHAKGAAIEVRVLHCI
jgi:hypothetical protein